MASAIGHGNGRVANRNADAPGLALLRLPVRLRHCRSRHCRRRSPRAPLQLSPRWDRPIATAPLPFAVLSQRRSRRRLSLAAEPWPRLKCAFVDRFERRGSPRRPWRPRFGRLLSATSASAIAWSALASAAWDVLTAVSALASAAWAAGQRSCCCIPGRPRHRLPPDPPCPAPPPHRQRLGRPWHLQPGTWSTRCQPWRPPPGRRSRHC